MNDKKYDEYLQIKTCKQQPWNNQMKHNHPYHATSYPFLDALRKHLSIEKSDEFVDFGCGPGRTLFYLYHHYQISCIGIEYDEHLYREALSNLARYKHAPIHFVHQPAQDYLIPPSSTIFYFFNPFSPIIFQRVLHNIETSYYEAPRQLTLILYYPSLDYQQILFQSPLFELRHTISLKSDDPQDYILLYTT